MSLMPSDRSDTERALPRRNVDDPQCGNPFCVGVVKVRGEFCDICRQQQARHREAMRIHRNRTQAK